MKKIAVFILNYNGIDDIKNGSLKAISDAVRNIKSADVGVVYLDNFSNDGSVALVRDYFDKIVVASTFKNEGYARGTNIGLELAWKLYQPDYLLLVDSDNFCEIDAYNQLFEFIENHGDVGMAQPRVMSYRNKESLNSCGHTFRECGGTICVKDIDKPFNLMNLESCSISSTIIRSEALVKTGLLNEAYEMYYESSDLSFRMRRNGYKCACCWDAVCYNERVENISFKNFNKFYLIRRNLFLFWFNNDKEEYKRVVGWWKKNLEELQEQYDNNEYIIDYKNEVERRAIEEGMNLENSCKELCVIPGLDAFEKNTVFVHYMIGV